MTFQERIETRAEAQRGTAAYDNYLRVRAHVSRMMDAWEASEEGGPSAYWQEEIEGFLYLFDASPLLIEQLREQTYHITGIRSYEYRSHHGHRAEDFSGKYGMLRAIDPSDGPTGVFVPESPALGGYGFPMPGGAGLANIDTLKFYEVMIGLERCGALQTFRGQQAERRTVVEIGSGWGGFAYQFKTLAPNTTYVCVDLPPTMLFSGTYLATLFPDAKFLFYGEPDFDEKIARLSDYDFVFLPHFYFPEWKPTSIDLAINMVSFQEMTGEQVGAYVGRLRELGCPRLYSLNRDRSPHNEEISAVSDILAASYETEVLELLDVSYLRLASAKKPKGPTPFDYRHVFGSRPK